ncbi:hypothetical protein J5N97_000628 [Dioscorea zingiberensis]|uniref:Uncharacterized protein n=1 Tax=Dioscorea zingiberensis TaxID=325984 RepID=A0A9D5BS70_9LILI|nr:hypothetical protein J5N97_000628 [Dioscorea zingiberensis]
MREVVGLVRDQRQAQHQQPPPPPPPQPHQRTIAEFKRTGPPPFEGTTDPDVAEKWIDEMEKAFDVMECTEEEKLRFATYMLQGSAYNWWKARYASVREGILIHGISGVQPFSTSTFPEARFWSWRGSSFISNRGP